MRRFPSVAGLSLSLLVLSACGQDVTTVDPSARNRPQLLASSSAACTEAKSVNYLKASIDSLMKVLTPNSQSAQSKFQTVLNDLAAGNYTQAQSDLQVLLNFIELKYGQVNTTGITIQDPATGSPVPIEDFKNTLLDQLTCFVSLNSFDLNPNDPDKVFVDQNTTAGVFFPAGFVPQGFNVEITTPTAPPLVTDLDQYPSFINIKLKDAEGNEPAPGTVFNGSPVVVVCFPAGMDPAVAARALVGHQASGGFELLPKVEVPALLANAVGCGDALASPSTVLGKLMRKAADLLLPERLHAAYFGLGGVGGSPEEFSPFGAVDPGLSFAGAGGSPEEFVREAPSRTTKRATMASLVLPGALPHVEGTAGEADATSPDLRLPKVRVATPLGTGIDGLTVTFTLSAPDALGTDPINGPDSEATLCNGATTVEVTTSDGGYATLPCLHFGTKVGYKNLKATFTPTAVDPLACILKDGACAPAGTGVNFLIETNLGAPTLQVAPTTPPLDAVTVGTALEELTATVADAYGNPYADQAVSVSGTGLKCVGGGTACLSGTTDATGQAKFDGLTREQAGAVTLTFTSGALSQAVNATFNAGAPAKIAIVPPPAGGDYGTGLAAFAAVSPNPTVLTTDSYDNPVPASVFWQLASVGTGATMTPSGPWASNPSGSASVGWTLGDGGNGLTAYLGTSATGPSVTFSATTAPLPLVNLAACVASASTKKTDLAKYANGGYKGYFSFPSKAKGLIRTAGINMSVTGQSSGTGDYTTVLRAYRKSGTGLGSLIATGSPTTGVLKLPGNNSSPTAISFTMAPNAAVPSVVNAGETIILELQITAPSTRTFQVWYNTKNVDGTDCFNTKLYTPALSTPNFDTSGFLRGMHLKVTN